MTMAPIAMSVDLQEELQKQLNIDEVFGFDVKGVHIGFDESTVVSWIIIGVMTIVAIIVIAPIVVIIVVIVAPIVVIIVVIVTVTVGLLA